MKKLLIFILLFTITIISCNKIEKDEVISENGVKKMKKIVVGMSVDFKPFEYREGKKIVGFDPDMLKAISDETSLEYEITDIDFNALLANLQSKKVDLVISGMSITEDRKRSVSFSNTYYSIDQVIIVKNDNFDINSEESLANKKIGVPLGTTSDILAQKLKEKYNEIEVIQYNKGFEAMEGLRTNKIDAIIIDQKQGEGFTKQNKDLKIIPKKLTSEEYAAAFRKDEKDLVELFNEGLRKIKENGKYNELIKKYDL